MPGVSDHVLVPLAWVGWLHLGVWFAGAAVSGRLLRQAPPTTRAASAAVMEFSVGVVVFGVVALLLGCATVLHRELLLALGTMAGAAGLARLIRARPWRMARLRAADAPALLAAAFLASFLPHALDPALAHDDNVYHVFLPKAYLQAHAIVPLPSHLYANMPHLVEVFYTWPLAVWDYTAPQVASFSMHVWILAGLAAVAAPRLGRLGAGLLLLAYVSGKNVQWHLGNAYVESTLGLLLLGAVLAVLAWHETHHRGYLAIVATLCGAAAASKYTGWYFGGAILAGVLLALTRPIAPRRARVRQAAMVLGISSLLVLPWLVKNAVVTGNPMYPNLYGWLGGESWSAIQSFHYLRSQSYAGGPQGYLESLPAVPWNLTIEDNVFYAPSFSIALMTLFLAAAAMPASWRLPARYVTASAVLGLACWAFTARQGRFLVAWVPVMTLVAAQALAPLKGRALPQMAALVLVLGAGAWQLQTQRYAYGPPMSLLVGDRQARVPRNLNYEVCQVLNQEVPEDGRVLGLWENRFFFLERTWDGDSAYEAPTGLAALRAVGDAGLFAEDLRRRNVTHVVVNTRAMNTYFANTLGFDLLDDNHYPAARLEADRVLMQDFLAGHLEERHRIGAVTIYRLRPVSAG